MAWAQVGAGGLSVMGRAFNATATGEYFDRLPGAAQGVVRDAVWGLSRDATGMFVPFLAPNATQIHLNYSLDEPADVIANHIALPPFWHTAARLLWQWRRRRNIFPPTEN